MKQCLPGKTVFIITDPRFFAGKLADQLNERQAQVKFSQHSPCSTQNIAPLLEEIRQASPDIVVIHQPNLDLDEPMRVCSEITDACANPKLPSAIPVVIHDSNLTETTKLRLSELGAISLGRNSDTGYLVDTINSVVGAAGKPRASACLS